jgi:hypothetical protein
VRTTWSREEGGPPELSVALLRGLALVCAGPKCEAAYRVAEQRSAAASLGSSARWKSAREQLGARDLYLMTVRDETDVQPRDTMISGVPEVALGLTLGVPESSLRVFAALPPEDATRLAAALPGGGAALLGRLKPGGPLYLRLGVDGRAAAAWLEASPLGSMIARLREEMKAAGGDLDRDLLSNLRPGVVLSVDLAPNVDLSRAMVFDPRQVNPFQHFTLEAAARVVDPARMRAALKTAAALAPRFGATVEARKPQWKVAGAPGALKARDIMIYQARYALGEGLAWALDGDTLVAGAGREGVIEDLLSRGDAAADPQAFPPLLRAALLAEPGSALALDLEPLTEEIRALPPEAFGTGPTAFSARAMAQNLLDPLSRLRAAVQVRPAEGGAQIDAAIELRGNGL